MLKWFPYFFLYYRNPSSSSLVLSETGSLDRAKAALERRKKAQGQDSDVVPGRVEVTRVNPDELIADLLKNTNLEPVDDSGESMFLFLLQAAIVWTCLLVICFCSVWLAAFYCQRWNSSGGQSRSEIANVDRCPGF